MTDEPKTPQEPEAAGSECSAELGATPEPYYVKCLWKVDEDGIWKTRCDPQHGENYFVFTEEGPVENKFHFCPYCGKPLEISA